VARFDLRRCASFALVVAVYTLVPAWSGLTRSVGASMQTFVTPTGDAQNVRFEQRDNGIVHIIYDLVSSDPRAVFSVMLEASRDSGSTFGMRPQSVTGDVGNSIAPGVGKRIVWDSGKDVERVQIDRFRFRILATAGPLRVEPTTPARGDRVPATLPSVITIATTPPGAQVSIDGTPRGITPITLRDLAPGTHRVTVARAGYLENSRTVEVVSGKEAKIDVPLTADANATQPTGGATAPKAKGGSGKWIGILGGAGAAVAAATLAGGGGGGENGSVNPSANFLTGTRTGTVANYTSGSPPISDQRIGTAPRDGVLNASFSWAPSDAMLRLVIVIDGQDSKPEGASCAFLRAACGASPSILLSGSIRQGAQVVLRVINYSPFPVNYTMNVGFP